MVGITRSKVSFCFLRASLSKSKKASIHPFNPPEPPKATDLHLRYLPTVSDCTDRWQAPSHSDEWGRIWHPTPFKNTIRRSNGMAQRQWRMTVWEKQCSRMAWGKDRRILVVLECGHWPVIQTNPLKISVQTFVGNQVLRQLGQVSDGSWVRLVQDVLFRDVGVRPFRCAMGPKLVLVAEPSQ